LDMVEPPSFVLREDGIPNSLTHLKISFSSGSLYVGFLRRSESAYENLYFTNATH